MTDLGGPPPSKMKVRPRLAEAGRTTAAVINDLVAVARTTGHGDLADGLIEASKRWPEPHATVVVVGERGAGRSTVVNALVGRLDPPLLPLGVGSVTVVRVGAPEEVRVHTPGQPPRIGPVSGPPEIHAGDSVEVVISSIAAGDQLVLVDAPAVTGPEDPRRRVIDALVSTSDAVILVTRADAPITAPEVDLLRAARHRTGVALVVTTRTDRHRGWRTILDESRATIRASDPRLADVEPLPLAAPLAADALAARAAGDVAADELAIESGLEHLQAAVRNGISNDLRYLRLLSLAELGRDVVDELLVERSVADGAGAGDDATAVLLALTQSDIKRLRELTSPTLVKLSDEFTLLRESVSLEVGRAVTEVMSEVNATLRHERDIVIVAELASQMLDAARLSLDERTERRVEALVRGVLSDLSEGDENGDDDVDADDDDGGAEGSAVDGDNEEGRRRTRKGRRSRGVTASMRLRLVQALLSSTGGIAMLAVVGGSGGGAADSLRFGALGVGMLVGGISAAEGIRDTKRQRTSQEAKAHLRTVSDQWRAEYLAVVRERLLREQRAQEGALREAIRGQIEEAERRAAQLQIDAGAGRAASGSAGTAGSATATLGTIRGRLDALVAQLSP